MISAPLQNHQLSYSPLANVQVLGYHNWLHFKGYTIAIHRSPGWHRVATVRPHKFINNVQLIIHHWYLRFNGHVGAEDVKYFTTEDEPKTEIYVRTNIAVLKCMWGNLQRGVGCHRRHWQFITTRNCRR